MHKTKKEQETAWEYKDTRLYTAVKQETQRSLRRRSGRYCLRKTVIIFVVNCGSSSIKYQLLNMNGEQVLAKGLIERIGMEGSVLKHTPTGKYTVDISAEIPDHSVGIQMALDALTNEEYLSLIHI